MTKSMSKKQKPSMMSIPKLRSAFDHIETYTSKLLATEKDAKKRREAFKQEWSKVFHRNVDNSSADAYLQFEARKGKKNSTTRRQRGGAPLGGAPLDYSTRPGIYGVYGTFPEYISNGFATMGDATNKMAIQESCNSPVQAASFPPPYTGFGAASLMAQKGGKRTRKGKKQSRKTRKQRKIRGGGGFPSIGEFATAASFRPQAASAPPGTVYTAISDFKGLPPYPSSAPNTANPPYVGLKPMTVATTAGLITRDLTTEI